MSYRAENSELTDRKHERLDTLPNMLALLQVP